MGRFNNKMPVFRKDAQPSSAAIKPGERKMDFHYAVDEQQVPRSINITLPEYLSFDHDIQDIANEIIKQTTDICIPIERRLNRLAKHYLTWT